MYMLPSERVLRSYITSHAMSHSHLLVALTNRLMYIQATPGWLWRSLGSLPVLPRHGRASLVSFVTGSYHAEGFLGKHSVVVPLVLLMDDSGLGTYVTPVHLFNSKYGCELRKLIDVVLQELLSAFCILFAALWTRDATVCVSADIVCSCISILL